MWNGKRISVIFPTYNEKRSIYAAIQDAYGTGVVDEVVVVNNNAVSGTSNEVAKTRAREVFEPRQGYGYSIQRGLREAAGDLLVISEPDGTFLGKDIFKLLAYADDFQLVLGTRTSPLFISEGANMGLFLKWGNWTVAKFLQFMFNGPILTDVGCTMRLIHRKALRKIQRRFTVGGSCFSPEMTMLALLYKVPLVEIPLNYGPRVGESKVTGKFHRAVLVGLAMIGLILRYRLTHWGFWRLSRRRRVRRRVQ